MWEILTAQIGEEIYYLIIGLGLFSEEQKECHKGTRGTGKLLYIDQHILNESKTRRKNVAMACIDHKKSCYKVPQSWIIDCFKMYKISDEVIKFIEETMKNWRVEVTAGGKSLAEVKILRDVFQGDALSPWLFVIAMIPLNHILRKCTCGQTSQIARKYQPPKVHERHQTVCQKWKRIGNSNTGSENIQSDHRDEIWQRKMHHANNEKGETTHDGRNRTTEPRKNQSVRGKGNLQILGNSGSGLHQTSRYKRKSKKEYSKPNYIAEILSRG